LVFFELGHERILSQAAVRFADLPF